MKAKVTNEGEGAKRNLRTELKRFIIFAPKMKFIREHISLRILWFVMALIILNCSVDTPDPQPQDVAEDLSYNDMESIAEIILEKVFNINDAIPEQDDDDDGGATDLKKDVDFYYHHHSLQLTISNIPCTSIKYSIYREDNYEQFRPQLPPRPPKA